MEDEPSANHLIQYHSSVHKKYKNERISLAKRRANTCQLANNKKIMPTSNKEPPINTKFDNRFYTPQLKSHNWKGDITTKCQQNR